MINMVNLERKEIFEKNLQNSSFWYLKSWNGAENDLFKFRIKSISIPYTQLETKTAISGQRYITDVELETEFEISFYETPTFQIHDSLLNIRTGLFNNQYLYFVPSYKFNFIVSLYNFNKEGKMIDVKNYVFSQVYILGISPYNLDVDTNAPLITSAKCIANSIYFNPSEAFYDQRAKTLNNFDVNFFRKKLFELRFQNASFWRLEWNPSVNQLIKSITIPYTLLGVESAATGQRFIKSVTLEEDFNMEFYEDNKYSVHDFLLNLRLGMFNNDTLKFSHLGMTRFSIIFYHYDENENEVVSKKAFFSGVIIKGLEQYSLEYESNNPLITSITAIANSIQI